MCLNCAISGSHLIDISKAQFMLKSSVHVSACNSNASILLGIIQNRQQAFRSFRLKCLRNWKCKAPPTPDCGAEEGGITHLNNTYGVICNFLMDISTVDTNIKTGCLQFNTRNPLSFPSNRAIIETWISCTQWGFTNAGNIARPGQVDSQFIISDITWRWEVTFQCGSSHQVGWRYWSDQSSTNTAPNYHSLCLPILQQLLQFACYCSFTPSVS